MSGESRKVIASRVAITDVWFVMDDSGSMYAQWGDWSGIRYAAALSVLGMMRRAGGGSAGVIHWGSSAPEGMALGPVGIRRGDRKLKASLTIPDPTLGGNDLPAALRLAGDRIGTPAPERNLLVLVITDGVEAVTKETHAAVARIPEGCVHMLLVDRSHQCDAQMEAAWRSVAFGSFTRLESFETSVMAHKLAAVVADSLGLEGPSPTEGKSQKVRR